MEVGHRKGKFGFKAEPREVKPSEIQFEKSLFKCVSWGKNVLCIVWVCAPGTRRAIKP